MPTCDHCSVTVDRYWRTMTSSVVNYVKLMQWKSIDADGRAMYWWLAAKPEVFMMNDTIEGVEACSLMTAEWRADSVMTSACWWRPLVAVEGEQRLLVFCDTVRPCFSVFWPWWRCVKYILFCRTGEWWLMATVIRDRYQADEQIMQCLVWRCKWRAQVMWAETEL